MKLKQLRRIRAIAPRQVRNDRNFDFTDATIEPQPEAPPEAVFDRLTGPFGRRHGALDEET